MRRRRPKLLGAYAWTLLVGLSLPVVVVAVTSFNADPYMYFPPRTWGLVWYGNLVQNPTLLRAAWVSTELAIASTFGALVLGVPAALALVRGRLPGSAAIQALLLSPLTLPLVVFGVGLLAFAQLVGLGLSFASLVIGHIVVTLPYVLRTLVGVYEGLDPAVERAAVVLGASPWRTFWHVTLPLLKPGIVAGTVFSFLVSFDNIPVSIFLVQPWTMTLPVAMLSYLAHGFDPTIAAISTLQTLGAFVVLIGIDRFYGLGRFAKVT